MFFSKRSPSAYAICLRPLVILLALFAFSSLHATSGQLLYFSNFLSETAGEKPVEFDNVLPSGPNVGADLPLPISWVEEDGPVGALVVGDATEPARSFPGTGNQSLRLYDYTSGGDDARAYLDKNFVPDASANRHDVRLDLRFQRTAEVPFDPDFPDDLLLINLGEFDEGASFLSAENRVIQVALHNAGTWSAESVGEVTATGDYVGDGVNNLTIVANAHSSDDLSYDGPEGAHDLAPYTYSLYINGARVGDQLQFANEVRLGKFGLATGGSDADAEIDFLIDDIKVSAMRMLETKLQIAGAPEGDSVVLSWDSQAGVGYTLESSADLQTWEAAQLFSGTGAQIEHPIASNEATRGFFRLVTRGPLQAELTDSHWVRLYVGGDSEGDMAYVWWESNNTIGKGGPAAWRQHRSGIHGFALPELPNGIKDATYTLTKTGSNTVDTNPDWDWDAQVYVFNPDVTPRSYAGEHGVETLFWSDHEEDTRGLVRAVALNAFDKNAPNDKVSVTLTSELLAGFYNEDGTPATEDGKIWFRVNPGQPEADILATERLEYQADKEEPNAPTLTIRQNTP